MDYHKNTQLKMYWAVLLVCKTHQNVLMSIKTLYKAFSHFNLKLNTISTNIFHNTLLSDVALNNAQVLEQSFTNLILIIVDILRVYALETENDSLYKEMDFCAYQVTKQQNQVFIRYSEQILDHTKKHITNLTDYGVNEHVCYFLRYRLDLLKDDIKIDSYTNIDKIRTTLFEDIHHIITKQIDPVVESVKASFPDFYVRYSYARRTF